MFFNAFKDQPRCTTTGTSKATIPSVQWMDEIFRESMWSRYMKLKHEAFGRKCEKFGRLTMVYQGLGISPQPLGKLDFFAMAGNGELEKDFQSPRGWWWLMEMICKLIEYDRMTARSQEATHNLEHNIWCSHDLTIVRGGDGISHPGILGVDFVDHRIQIFVYGDINIHVLEFATWEFVWNCGPSMCRQGVVWDIMSMFCSLHWNRKALPQQET